MPFTIPTKQPFYIFSNGVLQRKENTICFVPYATQEEVTVESDPSLYLEPDEQETYGLNPFDDTLLNTGGRRVIPINNIDSFFVFGEVNFNSKFLNFLTRNRIPMHLFNYYGFYSGSYYPREHLLSGYVVVHQVKYYSAKKKRMELAREFIGAAAGNIVRNLKYYTADSRQGALGPESLELLFHTITQIESLLAGIVNAPDIPELMGIEGNIRKVYYQVWQHLLRSADPAFSFSERVKRPPDNAVNALVSFGNSLMYSACLTEIYRTQLNPTVSFLHEPSERRFSLALDLAEIFKPMFIDRMIFKLVNTREIKAKHFTTALNFCHLNDAGRKIVVKEFEERMRTTIKHRGLGRNVSYRRLIRLECYKLIKHLIGEEPYRAFRSWW
ncbi:MULTISPECIES: type I-B CRISPR-associated endonuclease Cas1b [unclassified Prosthecochloris]|uniref:type I-B CRISPR-associated endonuclease Cas1b n=1 Tax=unclassified Prosthecochloris TaxID=2632826 RepID=UPI00223D74AF|nr:MULTISPECIES: type I-B CRISPR-associated endonuclease Cas1b [unclassified Prosthecochloris]UZJ37171.1 type I-B CRISPR-associated endonuclease Cas1b [Prosthecochloris sp. SCSIO W1103]UZJ38985.1 type I-B CRISPR-associated endonuclease Cas1b [Prosthecochloris sp. SCSIO W1102]